jgi:hypothetical protein
LTLQKYAFKHRETLKKYAVGAYDRDEAIEMVAEICGDFNFDEILIEELPEHLQK